MNSQKISLRFLPNAEDYQTQSIDNENFTPFKCYLIVSLKLFNPLTLGIQLKITQIFQLQVCLGMHNLFVYTRCVKGLIYFHVLKKSVSAFNELCMRSYCDIFLRIWPYRKAPIKDSYACSNVAKLFEEKNMNDFYKNFFSVKIFIFQIKLFI